MEFTKAGMLKYIQEGNAEINILPMLVIQSRTFYESKTSVARQIKEFAKGNPLAVRSSSSMEDTSYYSNAGKFESILNVKPEEQSIIKAVDKVYKSYRTAEDEQILIQPMLLNIKKSGVVFTSDIETYANYYTVNYIEGNDSTAVTSGSSNNLRTFIKYKDSNFPIEEDMQNLLETCRSIELFMNNDALDIEFAITNEDQVFILQVRPIAKGKKGDYSKVDLSPALNRIYKKASKLSKQHPFLLGKTTCFGVMPDWNPAEILGFRPKKLAISLYKELITDGIWAHQRYDYGYRNLTMHPLMVSFCGIPYIDTRITFNSFVPQNLNPKIAEKLVNYYLDKLATYPTYHDKIEFEIVFSCYYIGIHKDLKKLLDNGFNENEITRIEFALLELTNNVISPRTGLYKKDIDKIKILEKNYDKILDSDISLVDKIYWLLEECKEYGTLPFAGVARAAFIAVQFLKSFVSSGIIGQHEYDAYMNSLDTVNKRMNRDLYSLNMGGQMNREKFLEKYGHIRPGTYDILSKRYDEAFEEYFGAKENMVFENEYEQFEFSVEQKSCIEKELEENGLLISVDELLDFIRESIEGREYLKFTFTKSVSKILQLIEELGKRAGISREDMAYLDISVIKQLYSDLYTGDLKEIFSENINNNRRQYKSAIQIKLPSIIVKPEDIYSFYLLDEEPNFITQKAVTAKIADVNEENVSLEDKIVFIQSADPGYDYLFSKNIAGLVTQFGGANSHMAIRCAELGIPAVIGAGEKNFFEWSKCESATIDCLKRQFIKIS